MIVCPTCNHRNPEGKEQCEACAGSLKHFLYRACPSCGALNSAQDTFCRRCLSDLIPPTPAEEPTEAPAPAPALLPVALPEERGSVEPAAPEAPSQVEAEPTEVAPAPAIAESITPTTPPEPGQREVPAIEVAEAPGAEPAEVAPPEEVLEVEVAAEMATLAEGILAQEPEAPVEALEAPPTESAIVESVAIQEPEAPLAETLEAPPSEPASTDQPVQMLLEVTAGPLEGLSDVVPMEAVMGLPHRSRATAAQGPVPEDQEGADLFRQIASERAPLRELTRIVMPYQVRLLPRIGRAILYLLVFAAALAPLLSGGQVSLIVIPRDSVAELARTIQELPVGATVLLSFDYSPMYASELNPLALAVVRHLATRGVRMVAMSTKPEGIGSADYVYRTLAAERSAYRYGEDYALLGYLPGQEAGLRTLRKGLGDAFKTDYIERRTLDELSVTRGLTALRDFEHIIVLSDDGESLRRWIEQVQGRSDISLHALVTAAIEPVLVPYRQAGQLRSLMGAANGTAEYEVASGVEPRAGRWSEAYALLLVLVLAIAVVTNIAYISRRGRGRRA